MMTSTFLPFTDPLQNFVIDLKTFDIRGSVDTANPALV